MRTLQLSQKYFSSSLVVEYQDLRAGKNLEHIIEKAYGP